MQKNNWYVITGASCSGKTTLVSALETRGYKVIYETARVLIESGLKKGLTLEQIREDEPAFQREVLRMKIDIENDLRPEDTVFLDRAIPDTRAYDILYGIHKNKLLEKALRGCSYKKVFLLERLEYAPDEARIETKEQQDKLHELLEETYQELGFEIVKVPVLPIEERVEFILSHV